MNKKVFVWLIGLWVLTLPTGNKARADMGIPQQDKVIAVPNNFQAPSIERAPDIAPQTAPFMPYYRPTPTPAIISMKTSQGVAVAVAGGITLIAAGAIVYILVKNP